MKNLLDKEVMTKRMFCNANELDTIAEYLEAQAAKGWQLNSKTGVILGFKKCEPRNVKICVEMVPANDKDPDSKEFIAFCEAAGWNHIFTDKNMVYFENEDLDAEPIHTDAEVKLQLVHKSCMENRVGVGAVATIFVFAVWWWLLLPLDITTLTDSTMMLLVMFMPLTVLYGIADIAAYLLWYRRAKAAVECGEEPVYKRSKLSSDIEKPLTYCLLGIVFGGAMMDNLYMGEIVGAIRYGGFFLVLLAFSIGFPRFQAKHNSDKEGDFWMYALGVVVVAICVFIGTTIIGGVMGTGDTSEHIRLESGEYKEVYHDEIPLTLEDLGFEVETYSDTRCYSYGSPLMQEYSLSDYSSNSDNECLWYDVYATDFDFVYNIASEELLERWETAAKDLDANSYIADEPAFKANKVYAMGDGVDDSELLLFYDNFIVKLEIPFDATEAQKTIIADKLMAEYGK